MAPSLESTSFAIAAFFHPVVHAGHGNWVSPNFWKEDYQSGSAGWINRPRTKRLPAKKVAREALRAIRKVTLGVTAHRATDFLHAQIEHDDANTVWSGSRILGRGAFGIATLYTGHDRSTADEVDSLVVKEGLRQAEVQGFSPVPDQEPVEGLAKDAAILADLNKQDANNRTNFLRRFAFNPMTEKHRFYMEHCAMDLDRLKSRYCLYDAYLPELYIWHVFEQLCEGLLVLQQPPHPTTAMMEHARLDELDEDAVHRNAIYCIHFDLKLQNVFSCHETTTYDFGGGLTATYPDVQIGDFGAAEYVFPNNAMNPYNFVNGTQFQFPPERSQWKAKPGSVWNYWDPPPNDPEREQDQKHDVWNVGKMIMDLMAHTQLRDLDAFMDHKTMTQAAYKERGNHFLPVFDWSQVFAVALMPQVYTTFPYSGELRSVVRDALIPEADRRPLPHELLGAVRRGRDAYVDSLKTILTQQQSGQSGAPDHSQQLQTWQDATRLYFRENNINYMAVGNAGFPPELADEEAYHFDTWADPDWPELHTPRHPRAERRICPVIPDELVNETVKRLWPDRLFVDLPLDGKLDEVGGALYELAQQGAMDSTGSQRIEQDYATMGPFDILKAIADHPDVSAADVNDMMSEGVDRQGLLMTLRALDGNPQPDEPLPRRESYDAHYASTLRDELVRRIGDEGKNLKRHEAVDMLLQLDRDGQTGDGSWKNEKPIPSQNRKRKRDQDNTDAQRQDDTDVAGAGVLSAAGQGKGTVAERVVRRRGRRR